MQYPREVTNRPQQNRAHASGGDVRANSNHNAQCRDVPDRGESCSGGWAKQHSTAVSTLVRRSGLTVIGWEFEMDMTLGPSSEGALHAGERASQTRWDGVESVFSG
jgi:hypothetical protein